MPMSSSRSALWIPALLMGLVTVACATAIDELGTDCPSCSGAEGQSEVPEPLPCVVRVLSDPPLGDLSMLSEPGLDGMCLPQEVAPIGADRLTACLLRYFLPEAPDGEAPPRCADRGLQPAVGGSERECELPQFSSARDDMLGWYFVPNHTECDFGAALLTQATASRDYYLGFDCIVADAFGRSAALDGLLVNCIQGRPLPRELHERAADEIRGASGPRCSSAVSLPTPLDYCVMWF